MGPILALATLAAASPALRAASGSAAARPAMHLLRDAVVAEPEPRLNGLLVATVDHERHGISSRSALVKIMDLGNENAAEWKTWYAEQEKTKR